MPGANRAESSPEARISTGNPALDTMLEGGLVAHRPYLVIGAAGTGKSTLAIQFLCEGVRRGERVLLVTLEEPPNESRVNHRGLEPALDAVEVFDAIPDVMRYERLPFKDIASVRFAVPFRNVPKSIRLTPELHSVEVTITALQQMLRSEVAHKGYRRVVIDSLTALQYFCMKGFDPVGGAQAFLRFLSDLKVTTILTVESPLEDVDTAERMLARGEIRLFRWELDGQTVRAIGVEKFRGSSHDVRLHPYRIGFQGIDINLLVTISRDTRQIVEPVPLVRPAPAPPPPVSPLESLEENVRDFVLVGARLTPVREALQAARSATAVGDRAATETHLARATSLTVDLAASLRSDAEAAVPIAPGAAEAYRRIRARAEAIRVGLPPTRLPDPPALKLELDQLLALIPPDVAPRPAETPRVPPAPAPAVVSKPVAESRAPPPVAVAPPLAARPSSERGVVPTLAVRSGDVPGPPSPVEPGPLSPAAPDPFLAPSAPPPPLPSAPHRPLLRLPRRLPHRRPRRLLPAPPRSPRRWLCRLGRASRFGSRLGRSRRLCRPRRSPQR